MLHFQLLKNRIFQISSRTLIQQFIPLFRHTSNQKKTHLNLFNVKTILIYLVSLCISLTSTSQINNWENESFGIYSNTTELIERRTLNEKHFQLPDGKVDMFVSSEPINYMENGVWKTIFNSIQEENVGPYKYSNTSNLFKSYYPEQILQGFKTVLEGKVVLEMQNASMYYESNGERLGEVSISNSIAKVDKNIISYPSVYGAGIDLLITQKGGKRKLDYIIQNKSALNSQYMDAEYLVFSEDIILPEGWNAKLEKGAVLLIDQKGKVVSLYETPSIFDSNHENVEKLNNANNTIYFENFSSKREDKKSNNILEDESIKYELELNGTILTIITKVKMSFLLDIKSVYPILIDPTLTASIATITSGWYYDYQPL